MYLLYTYISILNAAYYLVTLLPYYMFWMYHHVLSVLRKLLYCTSKLYIMLAETCSEDEG
jgi:hypothetical protein